MKCLTDGNLLLSDGQSDWKVQHPQQSEMFFFLLFLPFDGIDVAVGSLQPLHGRGSRAGPTPNPMSCRPARRRRRRGCGSVAASLPQEFHRSHQSTGTLRPSTRRSVSAVQPLDVLAARVANHSGTHLARSPPPLEVESRDR